MGLKKIFEIFLISIFFELVKIIGKKGLQKAFKSYQNKTNAQDHRVITLNTLMFNIFQYSLGFFWIYSILSIIGIPIGTLIASAGIFSLAIGLGAQGFVSDLVNGFFILFEKQIQVGEFVSFNNTIQGTVVAIGLRTTKIKSIDGALNFVPNRNINTVTNYSRNSMNAIVQIKINPDTPMHKLFTTLQKLNQKQISKALTGKPQIKGIITLPNGDPAVQIYLPTKKGQQYSVKLAYTKLYLEGLTAAGLHLPHCSNN